VKGIKNKKMKILAWMAIPLTQGLYALVDGEDYLSLIQHKWHAQKDGNTYYAVRYRGIKMHREILRLSTGVQADHRNSNGLDNRKCNLRICTNSENNANRRIQCHSSRFKGVTWIKRDKKWQSQIGFNGKLIYLGRFDDEIKAAEAYDKAAKRLFGEFAKTNFLCQGV